MKNLLHISAFIFTCLLFVNLNTNTQWQSDVRLTNETHISRTSLNNVHCIAVNSDTVHIVWFDYREGRSIFYKRSNNGGITWTQDIKASGNAADCIYPAISVSATKIHVVYKTATTGFSSHIYYLSSTNSGLNWQTYPVYETDFEINNPAIAVSGSTVHICWQTVLNGGSRIINYKRSTDNGLTWGTLNQLTVGNHKSFPSICASGNNVLIVYSDDQYGETEITCSRSTNGGNSSWQSTRLTNEQGASEQPSISMSGQTAIVVWKDNRFGNSRLFYKRTTDAGASWNTDGQLTTSNYISYNPNITISNTNVHIIWFDSTNNQINYLKGINYGNAWQSRTQITFAPALPYNFSVEADRSTVHVLWTDNRHGEGEIYYMRDPSGNTIGIQKMGTVIPDKFDLLQNYPNPFNPSTKIRFDVPKSENVILSILDVTGREVTTLINEQLTPGTYEVEWDGSKYASGVYFYVLTSGDFTGIKKLILLK